MRSYTKLGVFVSFIIFVVGFILLSAPTVDIRTYGALVLLIALGVFCISCAYFILYEFWENTMW